MTSNNSKAVVKVGKSEPTTTTDNEPLSPAQEERFDELENQIEENFLSGFKLAAALAEIRDKRLYRENYASFGKYCKERWEYSRSYCERLADVDGVLKDLKEFEKSPSLPKNELQARVFVPLDKDQRINLFKSVEMDTEADEVTASLFTEHRNKLFADQFAVKSKPANSKDVESSPITTPDVLKKLVTLAAQTLARLSQKKDSKDTQLIEYLQDIIKLANPSTAQGKENSK